MQSARRARSAAVSSAACFVSQRRRHSHRMRAMLCHAMQPLCRVARSCRREPSSRRACTRAAALQSSPRTGGPALTASFAARDCGRSAIRRTIRSDRRCGRRHKHRSTRVARKLCAESVRVRSRLSAPRRIDDSIGRARALCALFARLWLLQCVRFQIAAFASCCFQI